MWIRKRPMSNCHSSSSTWLLLPNWKVHWHAQIPIQGQRRAYIYPSMQCMVGRETLGLGQQSTVELTKRQHARFHSLWFMWPACILTVWGKKEHLWETKSTWSTLCKLMLWFKPRSLLLWCNNWTTVTPCKAHSFQLPWSLNVACVTQLLYLTVCQLHLYELMHITVQFICIFICIWS